MKKKNKEKNIRRSKYLINIYWSEEDDCYVAEVPELTGCATHGGSIEEAARHALDAIDSWIEGAKIAGTEIPKPLSLKEFSGKFMLRTSPEMHRSIALKALRLGASINSTVIDLIKRGFEPEYVS
jgi:predicted RNase H-like HicB family nuclease